MSAAIRSTTGGSIATASVALMLAASRTADSAQSALRSVVLGERADARHRIVRDLRRQRLRQLRSTAPTTEAAPMFVFGAIAATSAARVTNVGSRTGTGALRRHPGDDRHLAGQDRLDDPVHARQLAARRVDLDQRGRG